MSAKEEKKSVWKWFSKARAQMLFSIGAAIAAVGILLVQLFVPKEQLTGWSAIHIMNLVLAVLAMICAVGLVFGASGSKNKQSVQETSPNQDSDKKDCTQ